MRLIDKFFYKVRKLTAEKGYTCDGCGAEVFSYPTPRLCKDCGTAIVRNDGASCDKCGRATRAKGVCNVCKMHVPAFEKAVAPLVYFDLTAKLMNRYKDGKRHLVYYFAEECCTALSRLPSRDYVLTSVPLTKEKQRARGYNQSSELALAIADSKGWEVRTDLIVKKPTGEQKHLSAESRRKNVQGVFRVTDRKYCKGKDFLVVDDVITTGATLSEIASVLLRAGAHSVCALTVACVPDRDLKTTF